MIETHVIWGDSLTLLNAWLVYATNVIVYCERGSAVSWVDAAYNERQSNVPGIH